MKIAPGLMALVLIAVPASALTSASLLLSPAVASATTHKTAANAPVKTGSLQLFSTESAAQKHCPRDEVVWLNTNSGIYHERGMRWYGNTRSGYEERSMKIRVAALVTLFVAVLAANASGSDTFKTVQDANAFRDIGRCQDLFNAMHDDAAYRRAKAAHTAGLYTFWPAGTRVMIASGNMSDVFVMARDRRGHTGCIASAWLARVR
jgi:hypothetical protein